jgi:hypothetical protein
MIDELYLLKAAQIRKNYKSLAKEMNSVEESVKDLLPLLQDHQQDLEDMKSKVDSGRLTSKEKVADKLLSIIMNLEQETTNYELLVDNVSNKMDNLRDEEEDLFAKIKESYPDLPLSVIKEEVNNYLKSQNLL